MAKKDQEIAKQSALLKYNDQQISILNEQLKKKNEQILKEKKRVQNLLNLLKEKNREIEIQRQIVKQKDNELQIYYNSRTFKFIRFFRFIKIISFFFSIDNKLILKNFLKRNNSGNKKQLCQTEINFKKINLSDQLNVNYGKHRSGWLWAIQSLKPLHNPHGILLDGSIERTFCWHPQGIKKYSKPWIGFIHVPPEIPKWFQYEQSNEFIFKSKAFKKSLPYCKGLYTLSTYHKEALKQHFDMPIDNLLHPTEFPKITWSLERFRKNKDKKIIQIGWWLRKFHSIYLLPITRYKKIFLRKDDANIDHLMKLELENEFKDGSFDKKLYHTAYTELFLSNNEYDRLISENIVFLHLYGCSASNTIIECIVRNTPVLVNRLPSVIEYLGDDYPFYFNSLEEAAQKAENLDLVRDTYQYLLDHPIKRKLTDKYFLESFRESDIYKNL